MVHLRRFRNPAAFPSALILTAAVIDVNYGIDEAAPLLKFATETPTSPGLS